MEKIPGGLQSMGSQRVRHDWATNTLIQSTKLSSLSIKNFNIKYKTSRVRGKPHDFSFGNDIKRTDNKIKN